jgi:hypothetical protein
MSEPKDKAVVKERPKKPPGYRKFAKLLKQVINAPPLRKNERPDSSQQLVIRTEKESPTQ